VIVYKENVPDLTAQIESISQLGILTIRFSEDLWTTKDISWILDTLDLTLLTESLPEDFDMELLAFEWEPTVFEDDRLDLKITWNSPLYISMNII
jgi:hypothetical protein